MSHKHSHIRELEGPGIGRVGGRQKGGRKDIVTIVFAQYRCMSTAVGFGGGFAYYEPLGQASSECAV